MSTIDWASPRSITSSPSTPTIRTLDACCASSTRSSSASHQISERSFAQIGSAACASFSPFPSAVPEVPRPVSCADIVMPTMCAPSPSSVCSSPSFGPASPATAAAAGPSRRPSASAFGKRRSTTCMQIDRSGPTSQERRSSTSATGSTPEHQDGSPCQAHQPSSTLKRKLSSISSTPSSSQTRPVSAEQTSLEAAAEEARSLSALSVEQFSEAAAAGRVKLTEAQRACIARLVVARLSKSQAGSSAGAVRTGKTFYQALHKLDATSIHPAAASSTSSSSSSSPSTRLASSTLDASRTQKATFPSTFPTPFAAAHGAGEIPQHQRFREISTSSLSSSTTNTTTTSTTGSAISFTTTSSAALGVAPFLARNSRRESEHVSLLAAAADNAIGVDLAVRAGSDVGGADANEAAQGPTAGASNALSQAPQIASCWASCYAGGAAWAEAALRREARRMSGGRDDGSNARRASKVDIAGMRMRMRTSTSTDTGALYEQSPSHSQSRRAASFCAADAVEQRSFKRAKEEGGAERRYTNTTHFASCEASLHAREAVPPASAQTAQDGSAAHAPASLVGVLSNYANLLEARAETCYGLEHLTRQAHDLFRTSPLPPVGLAPSAPNLQKDASSLEPGTSDQGS